MSSVGSGSSTVEFLIAFSVQPRASWSGILVYSDFMSKDTSLWPFGICIVLMVSIKFSVDCTLCLDSGADLGGGCRGCAAPTPPPPPLKFGPLALLLVRADVLRVHHRHVSHSCVSCGICLASMHTAFCLARKVYTPFWIMQHSIEVFYQEKVSLSRILSL